ncbi:MAG: SdrD B-like domain-containing protein [Armatimonadota bacterium]
MRRISAIMLCCIAVSVLLVGFAVAEPMPGAIWTTDVDYVVNRNIYDSKCEVYLNGGPLNQSQPGLPDGDYYYKVTNPDGSRDLSEEAGKSLDNRLVTVVDGIIVRTNPNNQLCPYEDTDNEGGEYKVWLTSVEDYYAHGGLFDPDSSKTDNFKIKPQVGPPTVLGSISGCKYYDLNMNGIKDPLEVVIPGWLIELYDSSGELYASMTTDTNGEFYFDKLHEGNYTVKEVMPLGLWKQTGPKDTPSGVDLDPSPDVITTAYGFIYSVQLLKIDNTVGNATKVDFGNICLKPATGGYTLGFWSNKNGQKILDGNPGWIGLLNSLNLKDSFGNDFTITSYSGFRTWLLAGNAVNMDYMLSVQLAATVLDCEYKGLDSSELLVLPDDLADCYGHETIIIGDIIDEANAALNDSSASRGYLECLKDILDGINNNSFWTICPGPCEVVYPVE